jgi:hypothetical protein
MDPSHLSRKDKYAAKVGHPVWWKGGAPGFILGGSVRRVAD